LSSCGREGINKLAVTPLEPGDQSFSLQWEEPEVKAILKPYTVKKNLSNISNIMSVGGLSTFDRSMLSRYMFTIRKPETMFEQPFHIYEENSREGIPNFITADSVLHVYHLICDYILRDTERERLMDELKAFTEKSFDSALDIYYGTRERRMKAAALKNVAYFGIAMRLMDISLPGGIPIEANRIIDNDVKKVKSRWGSGSSEIFPYNLDYKSYIAKGHYSRDSDFRNYYLTMMWYGSTPLYFDIYDSSRKKLNRADEQIAMAIIMTCQILGDSSLSKLWDDIYTVSASCTGSSCDLTIYDLSEIIKTVYGEKIDFNKAWDKVKLGKVYELAGKKYEEHLRNSMSGRIRSLDDESIGNTEFHLMSRIYSLEAEVYKRLAVQSGDESGTSFPKGLDIPSAFGNEKAYSILKEEMGEEVSLPEDYTENMEGLKGILSGIRGNYPGQYSLSNSIFWVLKGYDGNNSGGYPAFMQAGNWDNKRLLTYVSSVTE
jgi:hypothetical protein